MDENYPLLGDLLYKKWPDTSSEENASLSGFADEILRKVEEFKSQEGTIHRS